jgi:hypothetical protein
MPPPILHLNNRLGNRLHERRNAALLLVLVLPVLHQRVLVVVKDLFIERLESSMFV